MLVAISDIHLDDGTCGKSLSPATFQLFRERLEQLAFSASHRVDGRYRPIDNIDLLLLGDIFEVIHSTRWLKDKSGAPATVRPWINPSGVELAEKIQEITQAILEHNAESMGILRQMANGEAISLPPADAQGKPVIDVNERLPVRVNIYYMVGNHDWFYHLPGEIYHQTRRLLIETMGLQNPPAPIPYEPHEWDKLIRLFEKYRIFARHGDRYDKWSYNPEFGRDASTIGDVLSIDLITRFPEEVEKNLGDSLPNSFYHGLHEMINVRPNAAVPLWVSSQFRHYGVSGKIEETLKEIWNELVSQFLRMDFVRSLDRKWNPFDSIDELELVLKLTRWTSIEHFNKVLLRLKKKLFDNDWSFVKHAMREEAFISRQSDFIVYGHTHHHEIIPLDVYSQNNKDNYQFLVNTGTWRTYYDLTRYHPEQQKFLPFQLMSYLAFFADGERGGQRHEAWLGKLV
jgi:UDP-2,3-diacylglucosamine pyrophosphatase LpxH